MAAAIGLIGLAVGTAQKINQGEIAAAQAKNQAILAGYQADEVGRAAVSDENRYRREVRKFLGKQRATVGANGLQNMGSPLDLQEGTAGLAEEDVANIRHQAALEQWGLKVGAKDTLFQGAAAQKAANADAALDVLSYGAKKKYSGYGG